MSVKQDMADIYTKSSVYYLRLQYLVICYLIVLAVAFFVLPMPREFGIDGTARLMIGGLLYTGFAVLLVYAPKLFYPLIGDGIITLSPYRDEKEVELLFNRLSEQEKRDVEKAVKAEYVTTFKKKGVLVLTMSKVQKVATNLFFQCLLIELFCLAVFINKDYSLLISNPTTQHLADVLSAYTSSNPPKYNDAFFVMGDFKQESGSPNRLPFSNFAFMAESIFFIYPIFVVSGFVRLFLMFIFSRPILGRDDVFPIVKNANTFGKVMWALLGTLIFLIIGFVAPVGFVTHLDIITRQIADLSLEDWIKFSVAGVSVMAFNILISWRFIEDWFKKMFGLF